MTITAAAAFAARLNAPGWAGRGVIIAVNSIDGCPDPASDVGVLSLAQTGADPPTNPVATTTQTVDPGAGTWSARLTVPTNVLAGSYTLSATCLNRGGTDLTYATRAITVR